MSTAFHCQHFALWFGKEILNFVSESAERGNLFCSLKNTYVWKGNAHLKKKNELEKNEMATTCWSWALPPKNKGQWVEPSRIGGTEWSLLPKPTPPKEGAGWCHYTPIPSSLPSSPSVMRRRKGDGEKREPTGERTEQRSGEEEKKEAFDRAVWRPRVNGPVKGSHCLAATSIWYCTLLFLEHCLQPQCLLSPPLPLSLKEIGGLGPTVRGGVGVGVVAPPLLLPPPLLLRAQIVNDRDSSRPPRQEGRDAFTHSCCVLSSLSLLLSHAPSPLTPPLYTSTPPSLSLLLPITVARCCSDRLRRRRSSEQGGGGAVRGLAGKLSCAPLFFSFIFPFCTTFPPPRNQGLGGKMERRAGGAREEVKKKTEGVTGTRDKRAQLYFLFIQAVVSRQREREQGLHSSLLLYLRWPPSSSLPLLPSSSFSSSSLYSSSLINRVELRGGRARDRHWLNKKKRKKGSLVLPQGLKSLRSNWTYNKT